MEVAEEPELEEAAGSSAPTSRTALGVLRSWGMQALIVFLVALTLRLVFLSQSAATEFPAQLAFLQDARHYASWSERIAGGEWVGKHSFFMGPLYPYSLALVSSLSETSPILEGAAGTTYDYHHVFTLQAILGSLSCVLLLGITRLLLGPWQGLAAGLLAAGYRVFIYFDGLLMPTSQGLFVTLAAVFLLMLAARRPAVGWWFAAGLALGLAALSKAPALLLLPVIWIWLAMAFPGWSRAARVQRGLLLTAGCLPLILLATAHNRAADGDWVLLTANGGPNLWIGNGPSASGAHAGVTSRFASSKLDFYAFDMDRPGDEPPASEVSSTLAREAREFMVANPIRSLALLWKKFRMYFNAVEIGTTDHFYFFAERSPLLGLPTPGFGLLMPLGLLGFLVMIGRWREFLPLHGLLVTQALTFTAFFVLGRYRLAGVACAIVFAVAFVDWCVAAVRAARWPQVGLAAVGGLLFAFFVNAPIDGMDRDRGIGNQVFLLAQLEERRGEPALELFQRALESPWREGDFSLRQKAVSHMRVGDHRAKSGRLKRAVAQYEEALGACEEMSVDFRYRAILTEDLQGRLRLVKGQLGTQ